MRCGKEHIMSKFDSFISKVGKVADKAAKETVKLTDITATKVKIKAEQARLCDRYEQLGKAAETYLRTKDELPDQIAESLDEVYRVMAKIAALNAELDEKKAKYENSAKANEGEETPEEEAKENGENAEASDK